MSALQEQTLNDTVRSLGYLDVTSFAREQALSLIKQRIAYYQSRCDFFQKKYGMQYKEFMERFHALESPTLLEREDDSMEWETALEAVAEYQYDASLLV